MATQDERRAATLAAIIEAATSLFGTRGFDAVSIDDVAHAAGVSKGGIYHHVDTKPALFRLVFERLQDALSDAVLAAAITADSPRDQLQRGCAAFLEGCLEPRTAKIVLIDGPRVLGWSTWRELDEARFLSLIRGTLDAIDSKRNNDMRAHLLLGALDEAALVIASAPDSAVALNAATRELDALITAMVD